MNIKQMLLSFVPWIAFSVLAQRGGAQGATAACLVATALAILFTVRNSKTSSVKLIDLTGIATFGVMTAVAAVGDTATDANVIDFGRGASALVLGAVMLISVAFVPFTEQYARESVPREYWGSPVFRAVNRRISAIWAAAILAMGFGHLIAGHLDPNSAPQAGSRPIDLLFNWVLPVLLVLGAMQLTNKAVAASPSASSRAAVAR
jgi:hypothetical protein